jgi:hypothetical protein
MEKLTKTEKRAKAFCQNIDMNNGGEFSLVWAPSKTWGNTASCHYRGQKVSLANSGRKEEGYKLTKIN